jgi:AraC-like DNA-binding protein
MDLMLFSVDGTWEMSIIGLSLTLFTLANIVTKSYQHKTDWLLIGWLVLLNIPFIHTILTHLNIDASTFNHLTNPTLNLLHGPILYLYVRMLISEKVTLHRSDLWHLIPFIVCNMLFTSMHHPLPMVPDPDHTLAPIGPVGDGLFSSFFAPIMAYFGLINVLVFVGYSLLTISSLRRHQQDITGIFSQDDNQISLKWIYTLPAMFAFVAMFNLANENLLPTENLVNPIILHLSCFLGFVIFLGLFGVKQKPVFYFKGNRREFESEALLKDENEDTKHNTKIESIANQETAVTAEKVTQDSEKMSNESITKVIDEMNTYMLNKKPYLDCDFSVYTLAEALNIPRRALSLVLSSGLSKNFYQYVNEFRINEVKTRLAQPSEKHSTIIDIAFESGFNSKSSFNSLFKQHCGVTPSQFRKMIIQQSVKAD